MAAETRVYKHTSDVHEEGGTGTVAIVALVLIVLVGVVLAVMFWDNIAGTATNVVEGDTVVTDTAQPAPATTVIREEIRDSRSTSTVPVPTSDPEGQPAAQGTPTQTSTQTTGTSY